MSRALRPQENQSKGKSQTECPRPVPTGGERGGGRSQGSLGIFTLSPRVQSSACDRLQREEEL